MYQSLKLSVLGAVAALMLPVSAHAQWWAQHPGYLKAMSDLRTAYWLISHHETADPAVNNEEQNAMNSIRVAYKDLKDASIVDDKDIDDQPPPDFVFGDHSGRLHHAMDLLKKAHDEVSGEEDNPAARGFRNRAVHNIDDAGRWTASAIQAWRF